MQIERLDHLVLTVQDLQKTLAFYVDVLGMQAITFGQGRHPLQYGQQKINLHIKGQEFEPKAQQVMCGSADLCFITSTPLEQVEQELKQAGLDILEGPVQRTGAIGPITSLYVRDPDGNLIEISQY